MAIPVIETVGTPIADTAGAWNFPQPTGLQNGDLVIVVVASSTDTGLTFNNTWTVLFTQDGTGTANNTQAGLHILYGIWTGAGSLVFTNGGASRTTSDVVFTGSLRISGADISSPVLTAVTGTNPVGTPNTYATDADVITQRDDSLLLLISSHGDDAGAYSNIANSINSQTWTQRINAGTASGGDLELIVFSAPAATTANYGIFSADKNDNEGGVIAGVVVQSPLPAGGNARSFAVLI